MSFVRRVAWLVIALLVGIYLGSLLPAEWGLAGPLIGVAAGIAAWAIWQRRRSVRGSRTTAPPGAASAGEDRCPHCGMILREQALICRGCGRNLGP
jgi:hypothetical protein